MYGTAQYDRETLAIPRLPRPRLIRGVKRQGENYFLLGLRGEGGEIGGSEARMRLA